MFAIRPRRVRLDRPVFVAVTFPSFAEFTVDQGLLMAAVMGFGFNAGREIGCVDHAGEDTPARIRRRVARGVRYFWAILVHNPIVYAFFIPILGWIPIIWKGLRAPKDS